jgi:hypothetical protein
MKTPIPFIEETDERKLAIIKAVAADDAWFFVSATISWRPHRDYPVIHLNWCYALNEAETLPPTPDIIKWEYIHEDYPFAARDECGTSFAFQTEPEQGDCYWVGGSNDNYFPLPPTIVTPGTCDWKDSLQRRPE